MDFRQSREKSAIFRLAGTVSFFVQTNTITMSTSTMIDPASAKVTARAGAFGMRHSYINGVSVHTLPLPDVIAVADALEIAINADRRGDLTHVNSQLVCWRARPPRELESCGKEHEAGRPRATAIAFCDSTIFSRPPPRPWPRPRRARPRLRPPGPRPRRRRPRPRPVLVLVLALGGVVPALGGVVPAFVLAPRPRRTRPPSSPAPALVVGGGLLVLRVGAPQLPRPAVPPWPVHRRRRRGRSPPRRRGVGVDGDTCSNLPLNIRRLARIRPVLRTTPETVEGEARAREKTRCVLFAAVHGCGRRSLTLLPLFRQRILL